MNKIIEEQQATVYKAKNGKRRHFTKKGAYKHAARMRVEGACACEAPKNPGGKPNGYPGYTCKYHRRDYDYNRLIEILAAVLKGME